MPYAPDCFRVTETGELSTALAGASEGSVRQCEHAIIRFITHMEEQRIALTNRSLSQPRVEKRVSIDLLRSVPEEEVWLAGQLSPHTRRAYKRDVEHFIRKMN